MKSSDNKWLERFFSGRNILKWQDITNESVPDGWIDDITPWIQASGDGNSDLPLVLPCLSDDGTVTWYAGCNSDRCAQRLTEELMAFIGPSYSDFKQQPYVLDMSDDIESSFAEGCTYTAFRFTSSNTSRIPAIRDALKRYRNLIGRYTKSDLVVEQSFSVIRGEFDRALLVGDENQARIKYEQLLRTGRLSADNILYLEVRLLAGLGRWPQIACDNRLLRALSDLILPSRVLVDVIEALYRVYVEPYESDSDPYAALQAFRDASIDKYKRLFATRRGLLLPRVLKAFFFYELCRENSETSRLITFTEILIEQDSNAFNVSLRNLIQQTVAPEPLSNEKIDLADLAFDDFEYERALEIYIELPPTKKRLSRMLVCANEVGDYKLAEQTLTIIEQQHATDLGTLSQSATDKLESLRRFVEAPNVKDDKTVNEDPRDGWLQWCRAVTNGMNSSDAKNVLHEYSVNWDTRIFIEDTSLLEELSRLMGNAEGSSATIFRDAYSSIFEAFALDEKPVRAFKPLLSVLLTNTVLLEGPSQNELELVRQLVSALLLIGLTENDYNELISDLEYLMDYQLSLSTLSWALDIIEIFVVYSCPSPEARLRFFMKSLVLAQHMSHRLSLFHYAELELLCKDLKVTLPTELTNNTVNEDSTEDAQYLATKKIAIYTLTEQAGIRASGVLKDLYPGITIALNSDKVCTDKLKNLSKNADIFVFAWKSSSHQAFYCMKNHRPEGWITLQPLGKGSSSIVREIVESAMLN